MKVDKIANELAVESAHMCRLIKFFSRKFVMQIPLQLDSATG